MSVQTNVKRGDLPFPAGEDLTGKESYLVKLVNSSGKAVAKLPEALTDLCLFTVLEGAALDASASLRPLEAETNVRLKLLGTCDPGDQLVLADPATPADAGKVQALPTDPGTYRGVAVAEETGEDGQAVLARPVNLGEITVT